MYCIIFEFNVVIYVWLFILRSVSNIDYNRTGRFAVTGQ